ncbi:gametocyte-specific factor 1 isoform X2 [Brachyhypopomus gauderio]|uniref:gametocyte-specific factor 1 isoform X2 n=1 Tax=Brachyhypopomus gauderio TaxID=698409 RepID=UPI0040429050
MNQEWFKWQKIMNPNPRQTHRVKKKRMSSKRSNTRGPAEKPVPRWEDNQDKTYCNPDKLLQCPYDPSHKIRACRFPYHLLKCKKNHPQLASVLWTCPFNARHLMHKYEASDHMDNCTDRCSISNDYVVTAESQHKFQVAVDTWTIPACDEDWDQEIQEAASPPAQLVWRVSASQLGPERSEQGVAGSVTASLRPPRVLPWVLGSL